MIPTSETPRGKLSSFSEFEVGEFVIISSILFLKSSTSFEVEEIIKGTKQRELAVGDVANIVVVNNKDDDDEGDEATHEQTVLAETRRRIKQEVDDDDRNEESMVLEVGVSEALTQDETSSFGIGIIELELDFETSIKIVSRDEK